MHTSVFVAQIAQEQRPWGDIGPRVETRAPRLLHWTSPSDLTPAT